MSFSLVHSISVAGGDQRTAERFGVGLPYTLEGGTEGQTRDLSATGLSFESAVPYKVGAIVKMTVRYALDGHNFPMPCEVEVLRVEAQGAHFNIGARLRRPFFDPPA
ncbi:MAG: PilZ domain-containing protein [Pseudomonadota bacterium]|nr:PilZ domain-containing protein [Pseudomonadota bacterium]